MASSVRVMSIASLFATVVSETALCFFFFFFPLILPVPGGGGEGAYLVVLACPHLENVVALLTRPSVHDNMQVLCYIATHANKPSWPRRCITCITCL
jgi:hypothetical protein